MVPASKPQLYYYIDCSAEDYTLLTVWNEGDETGVVNITYTGTPDNTNPNMPDWLTTGDAAGKEVTIEPHESKVFRFFNETSLKVSDADLKDPN